MRLLWIVLRYVTGFSAHIRFHRVTVTPALNRSNILPRPPSTPKLGKLVPEEAPRALTHLR
ncbi:hypothetical protein C9890_0503 [Perkinsus sp. BL_2016]|nr:hypothetical protein C9890_0503 [Perkinsus sp. BL_2016]